MGRFGAVSCMLLVALLGDLHGQEFTPTPKFEPLDEIPEVISFFAPFFLPKVFQDTYELREYIRSSSFASFRNTYGDVRSVDAIFYYAMRLSWNNVYEALLISLFATMDHRRFGIDLPILGPVLWFPLTSEFPEDFEKRRNALPTNLFGDSTQIEGDRDKLQHFFGSAFLTYWTENPDQAEAAGDFIEEWEGKIIVGGAFDDRDAWANLLGRRFGMALLKGGPTRPSRFLTYHFQPKTVCDSIKVQ